MTLLPIRYRLAFCIGMLICYINSADAGLLVNDAQLRSDLAWLDARGVLTINLSTWPLSQREVERTLFGATSSESTEERRVINRVKQRLNIIKAPLRTHFWSHSDHPYPLRVLLIHPPAHME